MKKESRSYKAHLCRFILLVIFTLITKNGVFAQCASAVGACTTPSCMDDPDLTPGCLPCYEAADNLTDLKDTGVGPAASVAINAVGFTTVTAVKIEQITLRLSNCDIAASYTSSAAFNTASTANGWGITLTDGVTSVSLASGAANVLSGYHINFIVNVYNGDTRVGSRNYFTKVPSSTLIVGDTHITTVDGVKYDFQAVGEFVALVDDGGDKLEIQTRQIAVATSGPGNDPYSGLTTCVSVNAAVAARVGSHRVTYQPRIDGIPDSSGLQLRIDGKLTELGDDAIDLGDGGRVIKSPAGGGAIEIDFPDGASLMVTPGWWAHYSQWYLNVSVNNTTATKGISGVVPYVDTVKGVTHRLRSWLPSLPDGSNVGTMPQDKHQRFITLYQTFADAWRVTDGTSLFDYDSGKSTADYTNKNWPVENGTSCPVTGQSPKPPIDLATAQQLAIGIIDPRLKPNAIYDVMFTGEATFVQTYLRTQTIQASTTGIRAYVSKDTSKLGETVTFTANVARKFSTSGDAFTGTVHFTVDAKEVGQVKLNANGRATFSTTSLEAGQHQISAKFIPDAGSTVFSSSSSEVTHTVIGDTSIFTKWWFWALLILILIILFFIFRKKKL